MSAAAYSRDWRPSRRTGEGVERSFADPRHRWSNICFYGWITATSRSQSIVCESQTPFSSVDTGDDSDDGGEAESEVDAAALGQEEEGYGYHDQYYGDDDNAPGRGR